MIWITSGERRIPVQYAKRVVGRRMMGGTSTFIPLKVNMAGVIPVIFASSFMLIIPTFTSFFGTSGVAGWLDAHLRAATPSSTSWARPCSSSCSRTSTRP